MSKKYSIEDFQNAISNLAQSETEVESIKEAKDKAVCVMVEITYLGESLTFLKRGDVYFFHRRGNAQDIQDNFSMLERDIKEILNRN